jgi:hypothetical protein
MQLIENIKKDLKQIRKEIDELKEDDYLNVDREKYFVGDVFIHKGYGKLTVREQEGDYLIMSNWKKFNVSA